MKGFRVSLYVLAMIVFMAAATAQAAQTQGKETKPATPKLEGTLNVNTATLDELQMLPGIGPAKSKDIVAYRQAHGPFRNINELDKVKGIGKKRLEALKPYVALEGKSTLKVMK